MFSRKKISKTLKNVFSSMEYIWKPLNWGVGDVKFRGGRGGGEKVRGVVRVFFRVIGALFPVIAPYHGMSVIAHVDTQSYQSWIRVVPTAITWDRAVPTGSAFSPTNSNIDSRRCRV